ncbi:baseplate J/gp47 family protein [Ruminococcus sp. 5_1_39BFAA]|uniref:baseplate J/gp47 family protein n=1 Tax=Ruminococcus sp. 5_1_39BFAA TaxID=457412 RepID=UPI0035616C74
MIDESVMEKLVQVPDEEEEMEKLIAELSTEGFVVTNFSKGGIFYNLLRVSVRVGIELKQLAVQLINSAFLKHCPDEWVEVRAADYGKTRKEGIKAEGLITITRDPYNSLYIVKKGHMFKSKADSYGNYMKYYTMEDTILPAGEKKCSVYVQAEESGSSYNLPAGSIQESLIHINGCTDITNDEGWLSVEGTDEETIESLRKRCLNSRAENAVQTIDRKIKSVVDAVPGVFLSDVDSQHPRGQGTVDVIVVGTQGSVGEHTLAAVREAIKPLTGSYGDYLVKSATVQAVKFEIELYFDTDISTDGYAERAKNIVSKLMGIEEREKLDVLYLDDIITQIKTHIPKCRKCKIISPENDITVGKGTVLIAGDINVTAMNL